MVSTYNHRKIYGSMAKRTLKQRDEFLPRKKSEKSGMENLEWSRDYENRVRGVFRSLSPLPSRLEVSSHPWPIRWAISSREPEWRKIHAWSIHTSSSLQSIFIRNCMSEWRDANWTHRMNFKPSLFLSLPHFPLRNEASSRNHYSTYFDDSEGWKKRSEKGWKFSVRFYGANRRSPLENANTLWHKWWKGFNQAVFHSTQNLECGMGWPVADKDG